MSPEIPVAPSNQDQEGPTRKVLDQSNLMGDGFDEDILAEIERRLDREDFSSTAKPGDRVELDKADLPNLESLRTAAPAPQLEVDLSGEPLPAVRAPAGEPEDLPLEEPGKKPAWLPIAIGAGVVLLLAVGLGLWLWLRTPSPASILPDKAKPKSGGGMVVEKMPSPEALTVALDPFLVPLMKGAKEGQGRLLRLAVSLELGDSSASAQLMEKRLALRDTIYRLLRDRTAEDVEGARAKHLLQSQIKTEINLLLGRTLVYQVFFTEFVITG
ncbi:MAG: flagellar basal body-associated FliL family protein [Pseudomonadota bacterium]